MNEKNKSIRLKEKRKFLNIIYFVDSSKTRSFKLSLQSLNLLIIIAFVVFGWLILSSFLLKDKLLQVNSLQRKLQTSVATIFDYQSKYDEVYEKTYDNKIPKKQNFEKKAKKLATPIAINKKEKQTFTINPKSKFSMVQGKKSWNIIADEPRIKIEDKNLNLSLSIKNANSPEKVVGYIWANINLYTQDKKNIVLYSPKEIAESSKVVAKEIIAKANYFSIRHYKTKSFKFTTPHKWIDKIISINVFIMNPEGEINTYNIVPKKDQNKTIATKKL